MLASLDTYIALTDGGEQSCVECGSTRETLRLWELSPKEDAHHSVSCCARCFLSTEGRFKNQSPVEVLRKHEDISEQGILVYDDKVVVETTSPFGDFNHVHYTESGFSPRSGRDSRNGDEVQVLESDSKLTGTSEVFDSDGQFVRSPATYSDVAWRALRKNRV